MSPSETRYVHLAVNEICSLCERDMLAFGKRDIFSQSEKVRRGSKPPPYDYEIRRGRMKSCFAGFGSRAEGRKMCFVREKWLDKVFLYGIIVERKMAYEQRKFL